MFVSYLNEFVVSWNLLWNQETLKKILCNEKIEFSLPEVHSGQLYAKTKPKLSVKISFLPKLSCLEVEKGLLNPLTALCQTEYSATINPTLSRLTL